MGLKVLHSNELHNKVAIIMGTRPGIVKMAPVYKQLVNDGVDAFIIHTGQHYSNNMDANFFKILGLPEPLVRVNETKNYKTHAEQTSEMLRGVEAALLDIRPKVVLVCGDANTNLAAGLAARKLGMVVGHVEAGLRSHDWTMPEEHNRIILDHICELLFAPTKSSEDNLIRDNVRGQIFVTGNTIVDSTIENYKVACGVSYDEYEAKKYILLTCHREENVDNKDRLIKILKGASEVSREMCMPVVFPAHPRTKMRIEEFGLQEYVKNSDYLNIVEPFDFHEFLYRIANAKVVLTDSGGIQEEACVLKTPCVTLRDNTERPETLEVGSNVLSGVETDVIKEQAIKMSCVSLEWDNPYGDGTASQKISNVVKDVLINGVELVDVNVKHRMRALEDECEKR